MRIRSSFLALMLVIAVIVLGVTGVMIREAYQDRQSAITARGLAAVQGELMRLNELIGIERGVDNGALLDNKTYDPGADNIARPRANTDAAFKRVLDLGHVTANRAIDIARIEKARATVVEWRRKVDAAIVRPLAERPAEVVKSYSPAFVDLVGNMTPALNAIDAAISRADSDVASPMSIARLAADMRALAGARGTVMVNVIVSGKPIAPETNVRYADYTGRMEALWGRIAMTMAMIDAGAELKEMVQKTEAGYFKTGLPALYAEIRAGSDKGGQWPFTATEFRTRHNPQLYVAGHLRDAAVNEALRVADMLIAERTNSLAIQSAVAALAVLLVIGGAVFFLRRVVSPLGAITGTMTRIAQGEAAEIGYANRKDEVGDMAQALSVFQRNAEEKAKLEAGERSRAEAEAKRLAAQREAEAVISREIAQFCAAVGEGNFSDRIDLAGKDGVFRELSQQLNGLADTMQGVMRDLGAVLQALSTGDLTRSTAGQYKGAFAALADAARDTVARLRDFAGQLGESASLVRNASAEISSGSQDLAQRTESQAASIEETAASMHQITATVKQNADNAQAASQLAMAARETAEKGGSVVRDAVSAVTQIEESARKISDIVGLIDEIAFQTNLLALNASVEAARAGEAGKGFAVVAQEVRALAQRSANASKDIKALIQDSNAQVRTGATLVNQTGSSLTDIVNAVKKVTDIVAEIAAASREQATGLDQINTAVGTMDEMTQRNGALVEETSASAQNLAGQGRQLAELVGFFKTGESSAPVVPATTIPTRVVSAKPGKVTPVVSSLVSRPASKPASRPMVKPVAKPVATIKPAVKPVVVAATASPPDEGDDWQEF
ncbi:methyl-accepting chemotaxis protein [Ferrovibrio sp.]|uniref:methyl-accepting chemotaxis protein n=1 Tax=Ferrovibrio sp. TaxID=1917215 RepID=UPI0026102FED|nr:methyl-accepting chemotaxis protein [Ferrovibrio sp.]